MKATKKELLTLHEAAKQVKYLLSAVSRINNVKCSLSISQIARMIDGSKESLKLKINKWNGKITCNEIGNDDFNITIIVTKWIEDEKYTVNIL